MKRRLIDADRLIKKAYRSGMWNRSTQAFDLFVVDAEDIEDAPTVDAVEVVRCKDCLNCGMKASIKFDGYREDARLCMVQHAVVLPDDYCSRGVKMDEEAKG